MTLTGKTARYIMAGAAVLCAARLSAQGFITDSQTGSLMIYRDPARQASTEIDAVVNNPAGTAFLPEGLSLSAGISCDFGVQKSRVPDNDLFDFKSDSYTIGPTVQVAWKKGSVALSASFSHTGGYGRRSLNGSPLLSTSFDYDDYTTINRELHRLNNAIIPYIFYFEDFNQNRVGLQTTMNVASLYNWDFRAGAAFTLCKEVSVYGGVKANRIFNGQATSMVAAVEVPEKEMYTNWESYLSTITYDIMSDDGSWVTEGVEPLTPEQKQEFVGEYLALPTPEPSLWRRVKYSNNALSFSPVIGIDVKTPTFNIGAKYEMAGIVHSGAYKVPAMLSGGFRCNTSATTALSAGASVVFSQKYFYGDAADKPVYNVSASINYFPIKDWDFSGGLTFSHRNEWAPESIEVPYENPRNLVFLSLGCAYDFNKQVQFNFGVRGGLGGCGFSIQRNETVKYTVYYPIQFAFGLNFHFKS